MSVSKITMHSTGEVVRDSGLVKLEKFYAFMYVSKKICHFESFNIPRSDGGIRKKKPDLRYHLKFSEVI